MFSKLYGVAKVRNTKKTAWCLQWNMVVAVSLCGAAWVLLVSGSCISLMASGIHKCTALYWKRRCYHHSVPLVVVHFSNIEILIKILLFKGGVLIYAEHCIPEASVYACFSVIRVFGLVTVGWVTRPLCTLTLPDGRPGLLDPSLSSLNIFKNSLLGAGWSTVIFECMQHDSNDSTWLRLFPFFLLPILG